MESELAALKKVMEEPDAVTATFTIVTATSTTTWCGLRQPWSERQRARP